MRRLLSSGVLLSLGLVAAHAAVEAWIEARAVVELERVAGRLPDGARLSWARLDAKPLRLALDLEEVRLDLPAGSPVRSLELAAVRLAQAAGGSDTIGRVGGFRASDVLVRLAGDAGTVRAALVEGEEVEIRALTEALAAPEPLAALEALRLGPLRAEGIVAERPDRRLELPRIAIGGYAARRLEGLELAGLAIDGRDGTRGRLAELGLGLLDLAALEPAALAAAEDDPLAGLALFDRLRVEQARVAGLELDWSDGRLGLARLGLDHAGQGRIEGFVLGGIELRDERGGKGVLAGLELARVDWSRVRLDRLVAAGERLGAQAEEETEEETEPAAGGADGRVEGAPGAADDDPEAAGVARAFAGLEVAGELLRLEVGPLRVDGLDAGTPDGGLALGRLAWEGLSGGRFGAVDLAAFVARGEGGWSFRVDRFAQTAFATGPVDLAERVEAAPRTTEALQALTAEFGRLPWQGRTMLTGLALDRDGAVGFGIGRLAVELDEDGPRRRTVLAVEEVRIDPAALGSDEPARKLAALGIDRLELRARLASVYDQASLEAGIEELSLEAAGQAGLSLSLVSRLGADPTLDPVTASTDAELVRAELALADLGLVERWLAGLERETGRRRADLVKEMLRDLRRGEPGRSLLDSRRTAELERFLVRPGRLVIRLAPPRPVSFLATFMGALATPARTAQTLGLEIKAIER
jgi:hypothetical protein